MIQRRPQWVYDIGLVYCALIWGSTFYIVKDVVSTVDPMALTGYRFLISALLLATVTPLNSQKMSRCSSGVRKSKSTDIDEILKILLPLS